MLLISRRHLCCALALVICVSAPSVIEAQNIFRGITGATGDGLPDLYYFPDTGLLHVDTDGTDFVALLVSDPENHFESNCILCDGGGINAPPPPGHFYTVGYANQSSQWIRTFPLQGPGPVGVFDLSAGKPSLTPGYFEPRFADPINGDLWSIVFANDIGDTYYMNFFIPEPSGASLTLLGLMLFLRNNCETIGVRPCFLFLHEPNWQNGTTTKD